MIRKIKSFYKLLSPNYQTVHLEYKVEVQARYGHGKPPHKLLNSIIDKNRDIYRDHLNTFLEFSENIHSIKNAKNESDPNKPGWNNGFLPGLDIVGIYGIIAKYKPSHYIEIGSGNSTKVARKSINENDLHTKITSIDPFPSIIICS